MLLIKKNKYIFIIFLLIQFLITENLSSEALKIGSQNAKVTIKVFSSLTCPHCASFHKNIFEKLKKIILIMTKLDLNITLFL